MHKTLHQKRTQKKQLEKLFAIDAKKKNASNLQQMMFQIEVQGLHLFYFKDRFKQNCIMQMKTEIIFQLPYTKKFHLMFLV